MASGPLISSERLASSSRQMESGPLISSERFIKTIFLLLGVGVLLPWNAYISPKDYFVSRLCDENEGEGTSHSKGQEIEWWFSIVYNGAGVLSLIVVILFQHHGKKYKKSMKSVKSFVFKNTTNLSVPMMSSISSSYRSINPKRTDYYMVMIPLAVYLIVFAMSTLLVFFPSIPPGIFTFTNLFGLFICGVSTAIASSGIVGTAGLFSANVGVNPYFNGQAVGGLLVSCANFIATYIEGPERFLRQHCSYQTSFKTSLNVTSIQSNDEEQPIDGEQICAPYKEISLPTACYFLMGGFILAACMFGYNFVDRYKRLAREDSFSSRDKNTTRYTESVDANADDYENDLWDNNNNSFPLVEGFIPQTLLYEHRNSDSSKIDVTNTPISYQKNSMDMNQIRRQNSSDTDTSEITQSLTVSVWSSIQGPALSLFVTYFCTLVIFPVWTSELISTYQCNTSSRVRNDLFVPISFVIFNAGDLAGRVTSSVIDFKRTSNLSSKLIWASVARTFIFFCLFLSCKAQRNRSDGWAVVNSDLYSWGIQGLFAITNGILTNVAFSFAPTLVENRSKPQQVASAILNLALVRSQLLAYECIMNLLSHLLLLYCHFL